MSFFRPQAHAYKGEVSEGLDIMGVLLLSFARKAGSAKAGAPFKAMSKNQIFTFFFAFIPSLALADLTALIPESTIEVIADETSGVAAKRNLDTITLYHRTRASSQFRQAAEHVLARLRAYGFEDAEILEYPAERIGRIKHLLADSGKYHR